MKLYILASHDFPISVWSGGTSTELFIYPPNSNYALRDFQFRLSTATVDIEESDFTSLPGVSRKLMILDGEIDISHDDLPARKLKKFEVENFTGDRKTRSKGKCKDFNLMTQGNTVGELWSAHLTTNQIQTIQISIEVDFFFCYVNGGNVHFENETNALQASKRDLLVIQNPADSFLTIKCSEDADLVFVEIMV
jgi:environmental stress-induced protein Ves